MLSTAGYLVVVGNLIGVVAGLVAFGRWLMKRISKKLGEMVSAPIRDLTTAVDSLKSTVNSLQDQMRNHETEIARAHSRLDMHLETHASMGVNNHG